VTLRDAIHRAVDGEDLEPAMMESAVRQVLQGEATEAEIAALSVALRMKGETAEEIAAAVRAMRAACTPVDVRVDGPLVDTCGTGGDGLATFNVSTVSAVVVASAGVSVAKHGNRGVSSPTGSADVLEALGVRLDLTADGVRRCIESAGIGFMFAPLFHSALRHAAPVRRQLGLRTFWNLLGPLANPAPVTHQLLGVYDPGRVEQLATVLGMLGIEGAWVVHGEGGYDEIAVQGYTEVAELRDGAVRTFTIEPSDFDLEPVSPETLVGGDRVRNAQMFRAVLDGEQGGPRTAVLLNAGAMLVVSGVAATLPEGAARAAEAIDRGDAKRTLERWVRASLEA